MNRLLGTYAGTVENVRDPEKLGRIKARVALVYGASSTGAGYIGTDDIPWALPAGLPAGGSGASGGLSHLPAVGDHVYVRFLDGEPEKPIWEWGTQTFADRDRLQLHAYDTAADGSVGIPKAARWLRYGHTHEINQTGLISSTSNGYRIQIIDGQPTDGSITLQTALGNFFKLDDLDDGATTYLNSDWSIQAGGSFYGVSGDFDWVTTTGGVSFSSGASFDVIALTDFTVDAAAGIALTAGTSLTMAAPALYLGAAGAAEALLRGTSTAAWLDTLLLYLSTHTHSNGNNGSPTGPPITPPSATLAPPDTLLSPFVFIP